MKPRCRVIRASLLVAVLGLGFNPVDSFGDEPSAAAERLKDFELTDQYGVVHAFAFPRAKLSVLFVADQRGSDQVEAWTKPLRARFGDTIDIDGVADVSAVPGPLRGLIRGKFKKKIPHPVMMDWGGQVSTALGCQKNKVSVLLVDRDGRIRHRAVGEATETQRQILVLAVEQVVSNSIPGNGR